MKYLAGAMLEEAEYAAFVELCACGTPLPPTFEGWLDLTAAAAEEAAAAGMAFTPLQIDLNSFASWAQKVAVKPSLEVLRAYVMMQRFDGDAEAAAAALRGALASSMQSKGAN